MIRPIRLFLSAALVLLAACTSQEAESLSSEGNTAVEAGQEASGSRAATDTMAQHDDGAGLRYYVPVYSHIYYRTSDRPFLLTATLSIRNTDPQRPITLTAVRYYDSNGQLVRSYLEEPRELPPLGSAHYVVDEEDTTGGVGANFIVAFGAGEMINEPIVEAVMISTKSSQGISFIARGQVIAADFTR